MGMTFKGFAAEGPLTTELVGKNPPDLSAFREAAGLGKLVSGSVAGSGAAWTPKP